MPCVSDDGKPTESGLKMLGALKAGNAAPEDIAASTGMALFRVRSGIRDLVAAGYASENGGFYALTEQGAAVL
jgi:predicted transcriptional regulator